uniref:CXXC-type domain-containing protein n=1 Tax=Globodera pallida TaxID=36090 RepID=A0A183CN24_GLOPA
GETLVHCFHCRGSGNDKCTYCRGTGMKAGVAHPAVYTHPMIGTFPGTSVAGGASAAGAATGPNRAYPFANASMIRPALLGAQRDKPYATGTPVHFMAKAGLPPPGLGQHDLCIFCHGRGIRDCQQCKGQGKKYCLTCGGNGQVRVYTKLKVAFGVECTDYYTPCGVPEMLLRQASGELIFSETQPYVQPIRKDGLKEINEVSRRFCAAHLKKLWIRAVGVECTDYYTPCGVPEMLLRQASGELIFSETQPYVQPIRKDGLKEINEVSRRFCAAHLKKLLDSCRVLKQRHCVESIELAKVRFQLGSKQGHFYVYGHISPVMPQFCSPSSSFLALPLLFLASSVCCSSYSLSQTTDGNGNDVDEPIPGVCPALPVFVFWLWRQCPAALKDTRCANGFPSDVPGLPGQLNCALASAQSKARLRQMSARELLALAKRRDPYGRPTCMRNTSYSIPLYEVIPYR